MKEMSRHIFDIKKSGEREKDLTMREHRQAEGWKPGNNKLIDREK